jgi:hypothetical protein
LGTSFYAEDGFDGRADVSLHFIDFIILFTKTQRRYKNNNLTYIVRLPDNMQSNIIIVTDGVCGIPNSESLQQILAQLRAFTIAVSFIQVKHCFS